MDSLPSPSASILDDVRSFLSSLKTEWPDLFIPAKRPKAEAPGRHASVAHQALPPVLIPFVDVNEPAKAAVPEGDPLPLFRSRAEFYAPYLGVTFNRISVKDQRSLWGSCTRAGNLNFSWRLLLAPDSVLDYVVVHELAHRVQMNHSRRFWEVVERLCPEHRSHRRWLRRHGAELYRAVRPH